MPVTSLLTTMTQPWRATTWSTSVAAVAASSLDSAVTSLLPIWTVPPATCVRPVPDPPPCTLTVEPEHAATYCLAAASTRGWRAVEPAAVMLPATQLIAAALAAVDGAVEAAVDGALDAAVEGAVVVVLPPQAANRTVAARASAPMRLGVGLTIQVPPTGWPGLDGCRRDVSCVPPRWSGAAVNGRFVPC